MDGELAVRWALKPDAGRVEDDEQPDETHEGCNEPRQGIETLGDADGLGPAAKRGDQRVSCDDLGESPGARHGSTQCGGHRHPPGGTGPPTADGGGDDGGGKHPGGQQRWEERGGFSNHDCRFSAESSSSSSVPNDRWITTANARATPRTATATTRPVSIRTWGSGFT